MCIEGPHEPAVMDAFLLPLVESLQRLAPPKPAASPSPNATSQQTQQQQQQPPQQQPQEQERQPIASGVWT